MEINPGSPVVVYAVFSIISSFFLPALHHYSFSSRLPSVVPSISLYEMIQFLHFF